MRNLLNRKIIAEDRICALANSRSTTMWCQTMNVRREWAAVGATITRPMSEPSTGGVIRKTVNQTLVRERVGWALKIQGVGRNGKFRLELPS
jgi:hypothetical protein